MIDNCLKDIFLYILLKNCSSLTIFIFSYIALDFFEVRIRNSILFDVESFEVGSFEVESFEVGSFKVESLEVGSFEVESYEVQSFEVRSVNPRYVRGIFKFFVLSRMYR
jgi:hypothetical protein